MQCVYFTYSWSSAPQYIDKSSKSTEGKESRSEKLDRKSRNAKDLKYNEIEKVSRDAMTDKCGCKRGFCLGNVGNTISESLSMLVDYMTPWMAMPRKEHREKFFAILEGCALGVSEGGHLNKR